MHTSTQYTETPRIETAEELLLYVREKLADKSKWFGGDNKRISGHQLCTYQALSRVPAIEPAYDAALLALFDATPKTQRKVGRVSRTITHYNDHHTHKTILNWIERAIAKL